MCNFVPGECLAVGNVDSMKNMISNWMLPGRISFLPLAATDPEFDHMPFDFGLMHITDIPEGLEVLTISKVSAALSDLIARHAAVVELNYYLPFSVKMHKHNRRNLSPPARHLAEKIRGDFTSIDKPVPLRPFAFIDSGINHSQVQTDRSDGDEYDQKPGRAYDYSRQGKVGRIDFYEDHDKVGHGTEIFQILNAILPDNIPIISGKMSNQTHGVTVLRLVQAYAHMIAVERPAVVSLSLAPRDDTFQCPHCNKVIPFPAFHSLILPFVFRMAEPETITVFAAGNHGQPCNARHFLAENEFLFFAVATNSQGAVAKYSNYVDRSRCFAVPAFGGDPDDMVEGYGIFNDDRSSKGTSYAAPFVAASVYVARIKQKNGEIADGSASIAEYCSKLMSTPAFYTGTRISFEHFVEE